MRIAIVGPDGAGKTTISKILNKRITNSVYQYAGKNSGHRFLITPKIVTVHKNLEKSSPLIAIIFKYTIFYTIEYIENIFRFRYRENITTIYDRHPIDRTVLYYEKLYRNRSRRMNFYVSCDLFLRLIWSSIYISMFYRIENMILLVPEDELIFSRSNGQYKGVRDARIKRLISIIVARKHFKRFSNSSLILTSTSNESPDDIVDIIIKNMR